MTFRDRTPKKRVKPGSRPVACVNHTPELDPECLQCRALLLMIVKMNGDDL